MTKDSLLKSLECFESFDTIEVNAKRQIINFIVNNDIIFGKENKDGHFTGSAWIVDYERKNVLLAHHAKADEWFQLGGHLETNETVYEAALREAIEESGLTTIKVLSDKIYGIDVQNVSQRKNEKSHIDFDIFFIFEADKNEELKITNESKDLRWVSVDEVHKITNDEAVLRMIRKMKIEKSVTENKKYDELK